MSWNILLSEFQFLQISIKQPGNFPRLNHLITKPNYSIIKPTQSHDFFVVEKSIDEKWLPQKKINIHNLRSIVDVCALDLLVS